MKKIILILGSLLFSIHTFAQSSIWTEDFEGAWVKALNENKMLLAYPYTGNGLDDPTPASRNIKSQAFKKYAEGNLVCINIPVEINDGVWIPLSENYSEIHSKVLGKIVYKGNHYFTLINPSDSERRGFSANAYTKSEKFVSDLDKIKQQMLDKNNAAGTQTLSRKELNEGADGFTDKSIAAFQYAKENKLWVLLFPEETLKTFRHLKNITYIKENFILVKAKNYSSAQFSSTNTAYLFNPENKKYIPIQYSKNFSEDLKIAVTELKDPGYPKLVYDKERAAAAKLLNDDISEEFYSAEKTAKLKGKLIYIYVLEDIVPDRARRTSESIILKAKVFLLRVNVRWLITDGDGKNASYQISADKQISQILGANPSPKDVLYNPDSGKVASVLEWYESSPAEKIINEIEISAAEFKNPYSTKIKNMWANMSEFEKAKK